MVEPMVLRLLILLMLLLSGLPSHGAAARAESSKNSAKVSFVTGVKPLLSQYCYGCHGEKKKGGLDLRIYTDDALAKKDKEVFEKVLNNLQSHEMPPESKPQPSLAERDLIANWIQLEVLGCDCNHPDPGRVTIRRLNRAEYNNTIRDLVGVKFQPADDFPADDVGYGFDNIGDVLSLSPMLMEKYLNAAEKVMNAAITTKPVYSGPLKRVDAAELNSTIKGETLENGLRMVSTEGEVFATFKFPKAGEYTLRVKAGGQQAGPDPVRMEIRVDGKAVSVVDVKARKSRPELYKVRLKLPPGDKRVSAAFINDYYNESDPNPKNRDRNLIVEYVEVYGPLEREPLSEFHKRIFARQPTAQTTNDVAREIIGDFTKRAYRRPVTEREIDRLLQFFQTAQKDGENFETGIKVALEAVLVSPHFLFRGEVQPEPNNPKSIHPIDEYALASRLSYFLWSSMPDKELFKLAEQKKLKKNLEAQVKRMLKNAKARALVDNFAEQWLQIRNVAAVSPDRNVFPAFNEPLRAAMVKETELFFESIMNQDRSVLEFIDSDYTFVNEPLALLYGIEGITGKDFQRVSLKGRQRGGILTQASVLTVTSVSTRTSPVKRGKWVLENILGAPPPPPPPDVPELKNDHKAILTGTLRQRMEQHRADPNCAGCHARMDPIGFGFENYNAIGAWRSKDGTFDVDSAGQLGSGESFKDAADLKGILMNQKREAFVRCLSEKMLTYALGRGMESYDKCAIDQIAKDLARNKYKFSSLVAAVVKSTPFELRRGEETRAAESSSAAAKGN
ncbi:MAG: Protein of unknown function (DUF1587)/Protein of unknown function (DUF1592)/Protein of unknown [Pedosphaera sp.]|nr:Protein of unknown function (DUF1587)/Protein of unknown function (DUF1592)/Protein of unknown [Pedosphaera sp.]